MRERASELHEAYDWADDEHERERVLLEAARAVLLCVEQFGDHWAGLMDDLRVAVLAYALAKATDAT